MKRLLGMVIGVTLFWGTSPLLAQPLQSGEEVFNRYCINCHMESLTGEPNWIVRHRAKPLLDGSVASLMSEDELVHKVTYGSDNMPAFIERLQQAEIEAVLTYIAKNWH